MSSKLRSQICYQYKTGSGQRRVNNHLMGKQFINGVALLILKWGFYAKINLQPIRHLYSIILNLILCSI